MSSQEAMVTGSPVLSTTMVWGLAFSTASIRVVLAGGQIHGGDVESFAFVLVVTADHDDGDVGVRCRVNCLLEVSGAGLGRVVGGVFAVHADAERVSDGAAAAGFLLDSVERGDGVFGPDERTAAAAGAGHGCIGSDDGDGVDLGGVERKQVAFVLQEHDAFGRVLAGRWRAARAYRLRRRRGVDDRRGRWRK